MAGSEFDEKRGSDLGKGTEQPAKKSKKLSKTVEPAAQKMPKGSAGQVKRPKVDSKATLNISATAVKA